MDASTPATPANPPTVKTPATGPIPRATKPIALLLGFLLAFALLLVGALVWKASPFWLDGIAIVTATAGFFTAMYVRVRHGRWWWVGIGCAMLTITLLAAEHATWLSDAVWP